MRTTVTEALADIKTIASRIERKRTIIAGVLLRPNVVIDPHAATGGSEKLVASEFQAIDDLLKRIVTIRTAIQKSNLATDLTIEGETRTIMGWLAWRKEVLPIQRDLLARTRDSIAQARRTWSQKDQADDAVKNGLFVAVNEGDLHKSIEKIETQASMLDGQLSLLNATTFIDV